MVRCYGAKNGEEEDKEERKGVQKRCDCKAEEGCKKEVAFKAKVSIEKAFRCC